MERGILIITYHFPPSTVAATFRPLRLAKYLSRMGYRIWVLTATPRSFSGGRIDNELIADIPSDVRIIRMPNPSLLRMYEKRKARRSGAHSIKDQAPSMPELKSRTFRTFIAELGKFPDMDASWAAGSLLPALYLVIRNHIDVICTSGPPYGAHVLGLYLKKLTKRPWIAQYGNPWTANPSISWDYPVFKRMCDRLDKDIVKRADAITVLDDILADCIRDLGRTDGIYVHPNGYDPEHFSPTDMPRGKFTMTYAGSLYNMHDPAVVYDALNIIEHEHPEVRTDMRIVFAGPSQSDPLRKGAPADIEFTGPLSHANLVDKMNASHVLLDFLTADQEQKFTVSCKLYEYMAARRPMLAITPEGPLAEEVRRMDLGRVVPCSDPAEVAGAMLDFYREYKSGLLHQPSNPEIERYSAPDLVREFVRIIENVCSGGICSCGSEPGTAQGRME